MSVIGSLNQHLTHSQRDLTHSVHTTGIKESALSLLPSHLIRVFLQLQICVVSLFYAGNSPGLKINQQPDSLHLPRSSMLHAATTGNTPLPICPLGFAYRKCYDMAMIRLFVEAIRQPSILKNPLLCNALFSQQGGRLASLYPHLPRSIEGNPRPLERRLDQPQGNTLLQWY